MGQIYMEYLGAAIICLVVCPDCLSILYLLPFVPHTTSNMQGSRMPVDYPNDVFIAP